MSLLYLEMIIVFALGYLVIIFEKFVGLNKAGIALIMGVVLWGLYFGSLQPGHIPMDAIQEQITDVAQIVFFLLAAMAIVELIDSHHGFKLITDILYTSSKKKMLWFLLIISFFMSSILDNLTSMIVMISLVRKLVPVKEERWLLGSLIVISVNAGGAWTPIGDVTTTMLWISDRITTGNVILTLFLPSLVNMGVSGLIGSFLLKEEAKGAKTIISHKPLEPGAKRVFFMGVTALVMIPILKALLNLPPFMGALIGLGFMWLITDLIHFRYGEKRAHLRVPHVLGKIDTPGVLFFLGILLAISALTLSGMLGDFARLLEKAVPNHDIIAILIGLFSSIIDNVPLVAATIGMYDLNTFPVDSSLWMLIAYAAGTGGSILIIGSAAGVAFMGLEGVDFIWYTKRISLIALVGYFAGVGVYLLQRTLLA